MKAALEGQQLYRNFSAVHAWHMRESVTTAAKNEDDANDTERIMLAAASR